MKSPEIPFMWFPREMAASDWVIGSVVELRNGPRG